MKIYESGLNLNFGKERQYHTPPKKQQGKSFQEVLEEMSEKISKDNRQYR